ncbi:wHTH domain-containing protein [Herbiconiux daphne]|uniref:wHTH-Hsp90 Na associated domain-containing protein n=1 Tax=Herbiconiux daphne TaxID=2970914 RepID=A0ABT2H1L9_9MICO|nr:hypothetical protein [Herbiconiux daphne]MCS5733843.1 hypothetical protein [Herbiconiux daphne]
MQVIAAFRRLGYAPIPGVPDQGVWRAGTITAVDLVLTSLGLDGEAPFLRSRVCGLRHAKRAAAVLRMPVSDTISRLRTLGYEVAADDATPESDYRRCGVIDDAGQRADPATPLPEIHAQLVARDLAERPSTVKRCLRRLGYSVGRSSLSEPTASDFILASADATGYLPCHPLGTPISIPLVHRAADRADVSPPVAVERLIRMGYSIAEGSPMTTLGNCHRAILARSGMSWVARPVSPARVVAEALALHWPLSKTVRVLEELGLSVADPRTHLPKNRPC